MGKINFWTPIICMFQRFLLCSGLAAFVNLAVGYLLYGVLGFNGNIEFALSVAVAFLFGMGVSFVLNRRFTHAASGRSTTSELSDFLAVSLVGLALTTGLAHALDRSAHEALARVAQGFPPVILPETLAHVIAVGATAIYSFLAHKLISFRPASAGMRPFEQQN